MADEATAGTPVSQPSDSLSINISAPELWRFQFVRRDSPSVELSNEPRQIKFGIALFRPELNQLAIELSIDSLELPTAVISIAYRAAFEVTSESGTVPNLEEHLASIAAHIGPAAIYPFIRESISSASVKAGLDPIVLPVVNFREMMEIGDVVVPPHTPTPDAAK